MATVGRVCSRILQLKVKNPNIKQVHVSYKNARSSRLLPTACVCVVGAGTLLYVAHRLGKLNTVYAFKPKKVGKHYK